MKKRNSGAARPAADGVGRPQEGQGGGHLWTPLALLAFVVTMLAVFQDVLPWYLTPLAPDAMPFFPFGHRTTVVQSLLAGGLEVSPHQLYWLVLHPLLAAKLTYLVDTLALTLAGVYYLRACGAGRPAAWIGGLALGLCGYTFTLFSAGHRGYFHMIGCAAFAFGLLRHGFRERRGFHFVMLGACLAWGMPYQPDVFLLVALLAGAYALWLTFGARSLAPERRPWARLVGVWPGFLLSALVALAIAAPGLRDVLGRQLDVRKAQIASVSTPAATHNATQANRDQWVFATNWSLPPEDIAEFLVPGIFGNDSGDPDHPYWGRLGRPLGWQPNRGWMPNYRQHTVYLGVMQAAFVLLAWLAWRRQRRPAAAAGGDAPADGLLADVPFWLGAVLLCLVLAMGRYTPLYRLFYAFPGMDLLRAPVKFHHLVELGFAFLFGLGVESWWRSRRPAGSLRSAAIAAAALALLLLVAALSAAVASESLAGYIGTTGLGAQAPDLAGYLVTNLLRAALLGALAALLLAFGRPRLGARATPWPALALALLLLLDLGTVARRFVRPINMGPLYRPNVVTAAALAKEGPGAGVANHLTANAPTEDAFASTLVRNGLRLALPAPGDDSSLEGRVARQLGSRTETLWRATRASYVVARWSAAEALVRRQVLRPVVSFALAGGEVRAASASADSALLAEFMGRLPAAYVVTSWRGGLDEAAQLESMASPAWDPATLTLAAAPSPASAAAEGGGAPRGTATLRQRRGWDFRLWTRLTAEAPADGLLVTDERFAADLVARVDGRAAPVVQANALWAAVPLPAGRHEVRIGRRVRPGLTLLSGVVGVAVAAWGLTRLARRRRNGALPVEGG